LSETIRETREIGQRKRNWGYQLLCCYLASLRKWSLNCRYPAPRNSDLRIHLTTYDNCRTFGTPIYISAVPHVFNLFHTSLIVAILPASMYAFGIGVGALLCSAISEIFGRTLIYKITTPLCLLFTCVGGASENIVSIIIARFLAGIFAGPWLTVGSGSLNDIFDISLELMGTAVAVFFVLSIIWATQIGPMVSATVVSSSGGWRWTFWTHAILVGFVLVGAYIVPETYGPQIKRQQAAKSGEHVEKRYLLEACWTSIRRPVHSGSFA